MKQQQTLQGIGVVVTRPANQSQHLQRLIEAAGGRAILFPVLEIVGPRDTQAANDVIEHLDEYDIAIFISANAVSRALNLIRSRREFPAQIQVAAIGRSSARELQRLGIRPHIFPHTRFNSEALLSMDEMQQVKGKRIIIFRGEGGRELLADTLRQRGAEVEYAEVYRRTRPTTAADSLLKKWARGEVDVVTVTSNEGLHNLYEMVGGLGRTWLCKTPLVVVSERARQLARELGFQGEVLLADTATDEAMVAAMQMWQHNKMQESIHESAK